MRLASAIPAALLCVWTSHSALATSFYLPATQLDSPEARGATLPAVNENHPVHPPWGRIEAGVLSGTVLQDPTPSVARDDAGNPLPPTIPRAYLMPYVGFHHSLSERQELGLRVQPLGSFEVRFKQQLSGPGENQSQKGLWPIAGVLSAGITLGTAPRPIYITTTPDLSTSGSAMLFYGKVAAIFGYRFKDRQMAIFAPHYSFGSLGNAGSLNGSASQFGAELGWQYEDMDLQIRLATGYASGSFLGGAASFIPLGFCVGVKL